MEEICKKDLVSIRGSLRTSFIRSEYKKEFLKTVELKEFKMRKDGTKYKKATTYYVCAQCKGKFLAKDINVDHISEVGQLFKFEHLTGFIERLYCPYANLQVLCKDKCHKEKTAYERSLIKGYALL